MTHGRRWTPTDRQTRQTRRLCATKRIFASLTNSRENTDRWRRESNKAGHRRDGLASRASGKEEGKQGRRAGREEENLREKDGMLKAEENTAEGKGENEMWWKGKKMGKRRECRN